MRRANRRVEILPRHEHPTPPPHGRDAMPPQPLAEGFGAGAIDIGGAGLSAEVRLRKVETLIAHLITVSVSLSARLDAHEATASGTGNTS